MKSIRDMSQAELGAYVQSHLRNRGIDVVLSGGALVALYTSGKYISGDHRFANRSVARGRGKLLLRYNPKQPPQIHGWEWSRRQGQYGRRSMS